MKKECKQILCIMGFMLIGALLGYVVASEQYALLADPEFLRSLAEHNLQVPEPFTYLHAILGFIFLFAGIPTGVIIYCHFADKWLNSLAPKVMIAIITFPIYMMFGVICALPILIYKLFVLIKCRGREQ